MKVQPSFLGCVAMFMVTAMFPPAWAAPARPVFTDINDSPAGFGVMHVGEFATDYYSIDDTAQLNSNEVLSINQNGNAGGANGVSVSVAISNGENGIDSSNFGSNIDIPNPDPADPVFAAIGNPSGRLENGNVIRFSAWFRSDPSNPITLDPTVQPVMMLSLGKEAFSNFSDFGGPHPAPFFGDRLFNQDQQRELLVATDKSQWIDFNGDGVVGDATAQAEGRVSSLSTTAWTLVESSYTVDAVTHYLGIGGEAFGAGDVTVIESITAEMFLGEFGGANLSGDGNGGNLLVDNFLFEVFRNAASVTANTNPNPEGVAGDFDSDGDVDGRDFLAWQRGNSPNGTPGGPVSAADLATWQGAYNGGALSAVTVPEPSGLLLVFISVATLGVATGRVKGILFSASTLAVKGE